MAIVAVVDLGCFNTIISSVTDAWLRIYVYCRLGIAVGAGEIAVQVNS